jgi:hypothetical protein
MALLRWEPVAEVGTIQNEMNRPVTRSSTNRP